MSPLIVLHAAFFDAGWPAVAGTMISAATTPDHRDHGHELDERERSAVLVLAMTSLHHHLATALTMSNIGR